MGKQSARQMIYPNLQPFIDGMLGEVDHAIDKYPDTNATLLPLRESGEVLIRETKEVIREICDINQYGSCDEENLKVELMQVAGVCLMMYSQLEENNVV